MPLAYIENPIEMLKIKNFDKEIVEELQERAKTALILGDTLQ